ncbi:unnamed protein product [Polarella glacialis]|uniref:Major facilitator superfamily (MFS) profile domain-containing protein n=1 Tax=Polarella glacialis TaxID=89957 RepID=A0A813EEG2_POLGL|nr:unnamed protein product [Polarella glacialis]CAE8672122.1 unnamed protein product [Polarella glacialis]
MGIGDEFKAFWSTWAVLFFAGGMKNLVNQVELSFARSLVSCQEPVQLGFYTGSQYCGDRLEVIRAGYSISQQGQAQESGAMLCSIVLVAILGSVYGRKLVLMIGLAGTTSSVALFVLAGSFPEWARFLFVLGQGLQGLLPIDHIAGLIIFDLSTRHGGDGFSTYQVAGMLAPIGALLWGPVLGNFVQYLELVDYNGVWQVIFIVNAAVLILAAMMMPESAPRKKEKDDQDEKLQGPVAKVVREVLSYQDVFYNPLSWRFLLMVCIEPCWLHALGMIPVQLMAYHGWSQAGVTLLIFIQPLFILFFPLVPALCVRFGYARMMSLTIFYLYGVLIFTNMTVAVSARLPVLGLMLFTLVSGFMPLKEYVDSRFSSPEEMSRFKSTQWVIGYILGMVIGPVYAGLFNAKAQSYVSRSLPNFLACSLMIIQVLHVRFIMYPFMKVTLSLMDEGELKSKRLFNLVTNDGEKPLDTEIWQAAGLEKAIGKSLEEAKGPFRTIDSFREFVKQSGGATNDDARQFLSKLDEGIKSAETWSGAAQQDTKKKA